MMLERRVVAELTTSSDPALRGQVERWVEGSLDDMAEVLRLGVILESLMFSIWVAVRRPPDLQGLLGWLDVSPIPLLRSYARLFRSLVLFGELELDGSTTS